MGTIYKRGKTYWIKYSRNGKWYFESSQSRYNSVASELLKKREGEIQKGQIPGIHIVSDSDLKQAAKKQAEYFARVTKTVTIVDIKEKRVNQPSG